MDGGDILVVQCPTCGEVQDHAVLRAADSGWTVRCMRCKSVRVLPAPPLERLMPVPTILSEGPTARTIQLQVPVAGPVAVDDEFDVDGHRVRITAVERPDGSRPKKAPGREIRFLYAVMFDTVTLRYTLNLGEITEALAEEVVPEEIVRVGDTRDVGGKSVLVKTLKSDQNRTIHHGGLPARHIVRVFCDLAGTPLRRRGRLAGKPLGRRA